MKHLFRFILLIIGTVAVSNVQASHPSIHTDTNATSSSTASTASGSVAIAGGGNGGGGGTGAANFSVNPQVTITSTGSNLGRLVPSMIAPALTTTLTETCLGSASGAISAAGFEIGRAHV